MSHQRKRGITATVWKVTVQTDDRGNKVRVPDDDNAHLVKVWIFPMRSAKAEVPGQLHINIVRIGVPANLTDVNLWSRVEMLGSFWDVVTPPAYHHGTRHNRHWSLELRERP